MITPDQLRDLPIGTILHHTSLTGSDGLPVRCHTTGRLREWKRDPDRWEQPVKHGLRSDGEEVSQPVKQRVRDLFTIGPHDAAHWELNEHIARIQNRIPSNAWIWTVARPTNDSGPTAIPDDKKAARVFRRFKLSPWELDKLKQELEVGLKYRASQYEAHRKSQAIEDERYAQQMAAQKARWDAIEHQVNEQFRPRMEAIASEIARNQEALTKLGLVATLFGSDKQWHLVRIDALKKEQRLATEEKWFEIEQALSIFESQLQPVHHKTLSFRCLWWSELGLPVCGKVIQRQGQRIILGKQIDEIMPININGRSVFDVAISVFDSAIDILLKELKKREPIDALKARAAKTEKETRRLAATVKRQIAHQVKMLAVCPYCAKILDMEDAHADHIYPISKGGQSHAKNMVYVCSECNMRKGDATINQFIRSTGYDRKGIEVRLELLGKDY